MKVTANSTVNTGQLYSGGTINVDPSTLTVNGNVNLIAGSVLEVSAGSTFKDVSSTAISASGTINLRGGTLYSSSGVDLDGTLNIFGSNTITGNLTNSGTIQFSSSGFGGISIAGNYTQNANGILNMRISPAGNGNSDALSATSISLGGTLNVTSTGPLTTSNMWVLMMSGAGHPVTGSFSSLNLPTPPSGKLWSTFTTMSGVNVFGIRLV